MFDLEKARRDTDLSNGKVHFNNAGGALPSRLVTDCMVDYLRAEGEMGGYEIAHDRADALDGFYQGLATYLHTKPENIALMRSATEAFYRGLSSLDWQAGDIVLTTKSDYVSNHLYFLQLVKKPGIVLEIIPEGGQGYDPEALRRRLADGPLPKLVSITHIPTNSGRVQDILTAGQLCREYRVLYAVDACQSAGQLPLDVGEIGCDFLSATFRKYLRGPRGIGFLYVSDRILQSDREPVGMDLQGARWTGPQRYRLEPTAKRFEMWERSMALQLGAAVAMDYLNTTGITAIHERVLRLANLLSERLAPIANLKEHSYFVSPQTASGSATVPPTQNTTAQHQSGILLFTVATAMSAAELVAELRRQGLNATTSGVSHDQYHFREKGIDWALRLSVHYYNTEAEIERAGQVLERVLAGNE